MVEFLKAIPVISKLFDIDTDIPEIEKIENQYKLDRKRTLLVVLSYLTYLSIINGITYFLYSFFGQWTIWIYLLFIVAHLPFIKKIYSSSNFLKDYFLFVLVSVFIMSFTTAIIGIYYSELSIPNFIVAAMFFIFSIVFYSTIYLFIKDKLTLRKEHDLTFVLVGGEVIEGRLISITKRGDYIVEIRDNEEYANMEILLNRLEIQKVIYRKSIIVEDGSEE